jgi:perosamine synthetase
MAPQPPKIPVAEPALTDRDIELATECLRSGWISSSGKYLDEFEARWAAYCGRKHGVAVSSGTAALEVAVQALGLGPGDEVILPTFTIISCAVAVTAVGARPVLVDADPETWTMNPALMAEKISTRTRAIMPVHIYGHPADMDPILALAERHGLDVIEDAAEAHGAEYGSGLDKPGGERVWRRCGSFGRLSCFSFYANKIITTGEGGMVVTDDEALARRVRSLRNLCFKVPRFHHDELSHNFRLTNLQAALGVAQLERIEQILARKREMGQRYTARLGQNPKLQLPARKDWAKNVYWMFGVVLRDGAGLDAGELAARLSEHGIETRPFFLGMHAQPALRSHGWFKEDHYPVADRLAQQGLYLPSGVSLGWDELEFVCSRLEEALA